jgi:hypothetical protein
MRGLTDGETSLSRRKTARPEPSVASLDRNANEAAICYFVGLTSTQRRQRS